ncbi:MAG TPA: CsgG/HfaB family protein [Verrucomicrobiae bacterium]|jgi:Ca2+-binding EF-hand superfamily protein
MAQTNQPVKLALISEADAVGPVADMLTAKLSEGGQLQILERDQIEKICREQSLSVAGKDFLKIGQLLGADGLLLLNIVRLPQATNLTARLIAVKPGVILTDRSFSWPLKDMLQWSDSIAADFHSFLPKLKVARAEAIPISVVNLRSAISSAAAAATEQQLKLLVIQRLSQERQLFVLERQKLQLADDEKSLAADDSAFWDGSYLLEGAVDQNGYLSDTITIDARLTPAKGGAPVLFAVRGSRTNLTEVVNQLVAKVNETLNIQSAAPAWSATDEAAQFFKEAQWALQWGDNREAQSAADSAWMLGKKDLACALVRVQACVSELKATTAEFENGESTLDPGSYDANNHPLGTTPTEAEVQKELARLSKGNRFGFVYWVHEANSAKIIDYSLALQPPDPKNIDRALHVLELYYEFSRTSPDGESKIIYGGDGSADWHNSDWYNLGIETLVAASKVLRSFNLAPRLQPSVADKLAELRALARSVADVISETSAVRDTYFPGAQPSRDEEAEHIIGGAELGDSKSIFDCEVNWGCLWQETPEDCVALYRRLMSSPVFFYIQKNLWHRQRYFNPAPFTRIAGWNDADRKRAGEVWHDFMQELNSSTNALWRIEEQALAVADAESDQQLEITFVTLMDDIKTNQAELVGNNVNLFYNSSGFDELLGHWSVSPVWSKLDNEWRTNYSSMLDSLESEHHEFIREKIEAAKFLPVFNKQKEYLRTNQPYNFSEFAALFRLPEYSTNQALELLPLVAAYKSNLMVKAESATGRQKAELRSAIFFVDAWGKNVQRVINPPPTPHFPQPVQAAQPIPIAKKGEPVSVQAPEAVTNIMVVGKFLTIPTNGLPDDWYEAGFKTKIIAHHWYGEKLLLDFEYEFISVLFDPRGNGDYHTPTGNLPAIALFDPATEHWDIVRCPEADADYMSKNTFYHRSAFWRGELFNSDGKKIQKYDAQSHQWVNLPVSDGNNYELFVVNGGLYAANANTIFEITDGGKGSHILASRKRQPPASILDTQELGTPVLFEGPESSLRAGVGKKIFTWKNGDWSEDFTVPAGTYPLAISLFPDGTLLQVQDFIGVENLLLLPKTSRIPELGLWQKPESPRADFYKTAAPSRLWLMPPGQDLTKMSLALDASNLYALANHEISAGENFSKEGYNASLFYFSRSLPTPEKLFLRFEAPGGCPPIPGAQPDMTADFHFSNMPEQNAWMIPTVGFLIFGLEGVTYPTYVNRSAAYQSGIWLLPTAQLEPAIKTQRQSQLAQQAQAVAAAEQAQKNLLAKYDLNHNGVIDPDEREAAVDDQAFIAWQLDLIDTNHNGRLDLEELVYFDANQNKITEPKERAGINATRHLLAQRDLKNFDVDGDGSLDKKEFQELLLSLNWVDIKSSGGVFFDGHSYHYGECEQAFRNADDNRDGKIDQPELESYLRQQKQNMFHRQDGAGSLTNHPGWLRPQSFPSGHEPGSGPPSFQKN